MYQVFHNPEEFTRNSKIQFQFNDHHPSFQINFKVPLIYVTKEQFQNILQRGLQFKIQITFVLFTKGKGKK